MARNNAAEKYLASRLQNYLAEHYPGATLSGFQFITSGYESEVYAFNLQGASETPKDLILRLLPGEGALQKLTREAHGLRLLHQAGYPVPELFLYETNPAHLGKPFTIQERLSGRSLWPILAQSTPEQAGHLLRRFGELQARLHQLDWKPFTAKAALYESNPTVMSKDS
jgi:aminoglycoside phosphotransferase (APT) family kinase protein